MGVLYVFSSELRITIIFIIIFLAIGKTPQFDRNGTAAAGRIK